MGHGTLEREDGRQAVGVTGILLRHLIGHEADVVVAMRCLGRPSRVDHVDLRADLVDRPEPGEGGQVDHLARVVVDEHLGVLDCHLLECVPHPDVGAGLGVVVTAACAGSLLRRDGS